jgi:hypothetical protein
MDRASETPGERRARYLQFAAEAEIAAFRCADARIKDAYVNIAKSWTSLAGELLFAADDCRGGDST